MTGEVDGQMLCARLTKADYQPAFASGFSGECLRVIMSQRR